jgi:hypothetical protein
MYFENKRKLTCLYCYGSFKTERDVVSYLEDDDDDIIRNGVSAAFVMM